MDLQPVNTLDWIDNNTGELATLEQVQQAQASGDYSSLSPIDDASGELLNTTPINNPEIPSPGNTPPPPGYAWFYTPSNDRVPVALSAIPDQLWSYMSPAQMNPGDIGPSVPAGAGAPAMAGLFSGGAMTWLLIGGVVWYFFMRK